MLTQEQIHYLVALPKEIEGNNSVNLGYNKIRINLFSPEDDEWKFIVEINRSKKSQLRISLHHQENNTKIGLLRIDYSSGHTNPEIANDFVPDFLKPYANEQIDMPHIHFQVDSYKDLAWAIPLTDYKEFDVLEIITSEDYSNAIIAFANKVNIITKFTIQQAII